MVVEWTTLKILMPEIVLVVMASWIYIGCTLRLKQSREAWAVIALATYGVAGLGLWMQTTASDWLLWREIYGQGRDVASGPLVIDLLGNMCRWLALALGAALTLLAAESVTRQVGAEFLATLMLLVAGLMLVGSAGELVLLVVALELISIPTYVLLFLGRQGRGCAEATAKYFFLSILASAVLLYGVSLLYGAGGHTSLTTLTELLRHPSSASASALVNVAMVLIVAGLGFKLAMVPLHFYAPDVYQGTTSGNAALLAVVPKLAAVVALMRVMPLWVGASEGFAWRLLVVLSVLTMTVGNVCALWQRHVRRLLAYSSVAHAGYLLIGLAAGAAMPESGGLAAAMFYIVVYAVGAMGAFAVLNWLGDERREVETVEDLAGALRRHPVAAGLMALSMLTLAGVPPLAGFWGKFSLFSSAVAVVLRGESERLAWWFGTLAIVGALNAAVAAAYYLRVVAVMYFGEPAAQRAGGQRSSAAVATVACGLLIVLLGVVPGPVLRLSELATQPIKMRAAGYMTAAEDSPVLRAAARSGPAD